MKEKRRFKSYFHSFEIFAAILLWYSAFCTDSFLMAQKIDLLDNKSKMQVLHQIDSLLATKYVLPEKAQKYTEQFRKKYQSGAYNTYTNSRAFAEKVTADLINLTNDKHIHFRVIESSHIGEKPVSALHHPIRYHLLGTKENKGFSKLEWLDGNIGYLDLRRFYYFSDIKDLADLSMKFLSNANAIIIDLRENGGGSGDYLSSYFLAYPTQLNSWYSREDDILEEFWTAKEIGMEPLTEVPLFLLTSKKTFSAAESFVYDLKVRQRATIVGDSTKGGAHSVDLYAIDHQFEIYLPTARAINPLTGENWEGTGVIPDVIVPSESALDTALVLAQKAGAEFARTKAAKLKLAVEKMQNYLERVEAFFREDKIDEAEASLDSVFQIADKNHLVNQFFIDVLAYHYSAKQDEQILYAILKKKIEFYPQSPDAYKTLGYAYYKNRKETLAIAAFEKALELDPDNRNAQNMIERLRSE